MFSPFIVDTNHRYTVAHHNLFLIGLVRCIVIILAEVGILINQQWLHFSFNSEFTQMVLGAFTIVTALTFFRLQATKPVTSLETIGQLTLDVVFTTSLFGLTGGPANPFVSFLLFPLTVSAAILPWRYTWVMMLLTITCYASLFLLPNAEHYTPHHITSSIHHAATKSPSLEHSAFSLHMAGMWVNFTLSGLFISFFIVMMRNQIKKQQFKINEQRETALKDEQLIGIATEAATAAHHMSTPLSTMAVIVNDLLSSPANKHIKDDILTLSAQLDNCKTVLAGLRHHADAKNNPLTSISTSLFIKNLIDEFRLLRPEATISEDLQDSLEEASLIADAPLRLSILNVLNNSADSYPTEILFNAYIENNSLHITIRDFGPGIPEHLEGAISQPTTSTKADGMGLGLFLSHSTINRFGGSLRLTNATGGGTITHIELPLQQTI
ncbi:MAG: hypothetical protein COA99_00905 [Moraxellaceae bacterium]|nr:MAG: hypothetical protein COA99_00905 [Moraxellaceae bacterium]